MLSRNASRIHRHNRIRARIQGTETTPRISVFMSAKHIYAQLVDDDKSQTITSASDYEITDKKGKPEEIANKVGKLLAKKATDKKIITAVFDRSGYQYHGKVKALAEGARENGLQF